MRRKREKIETWKLLITSHRIKNMCTSSANNETNQQSPTLVRTSGSAFVKCVGAPHRNSQSERVWDNIVCCSSLLSPLSLSLSLSPTGVMRLDISEADLCMYRMSTKEGFWLNEYFQKTKMSLSHEVYLAQNRRKVL